MGEQLGWKALLWAARKAESDDPPSADALYERAIHSAETGQRKEDIAVAQCLFAYAEYLMRCGRDDDAQKIQMRAQTIVENIVPPDNQ